MRLKPASLVLTKLTVLDQLGEDVFQLPACRRGRIVLHEELMQIRTSPFGLLYGPQNVFLVDWLLFPLSAAAHFTQSIGLGS